MTASKLMGVGILHKETSITVHPQGEKREGTSIDEDERKRMDSASKRTCTRLCLQR